MSAQLGSVGVGLSVAFALFMLILSVELYYVWTSRQKRRRGAEMRNCRTPVKQVQWSSTWRHFVAASWSGLGAEEVKRWVVKLRRHHSSAQTGAGIVGEKELEAAALEKTLEDGEKQQHEDEDEDDEEEEDVFRVGGPLGPPRLLFTIKEETKEEVELEESHLMQAAGWPSKGSHRVSHASGDFLFDTSACTSPFVTPPSSPPFTTPFGSPAALHLPLPFGVKPIKDTVPTHDMESSSSSSSSASPPPGCHRLSARFEETSSFSSTSSSELPASPSPSIPLSSTSPMKRQRHPLSLLLDPPLSPSSALYHYHNRVHPLIYLPPPHNYHLHMLGNPLSKDVELPPPSSSFHLPDPSQPTTPCPFRASMDATSIGLLMSATSAATIHLTEV